MAKTNGRGRQPRKGAEMFMAGTIYVELTRESLNKLARGEAVRFRKAIRKRILQSGIPLASRGEILGELAEARRERR